MKCWRAGWTQSGSARLSHRAAQLFNDAGCSLLLHLLHHCLHLWGPKEPKDLFFLFECVLWTEFVREAHWSFCFTKTIKTSVITEKQICDFGKLDNDLVLCYWLIPGDVMKTMQPIRLEQSKESTLDPWCLDLTRAGQNSLSLKTSL